MASASKPSVNEPTKEFTCYVVVQGVQLICVSAGSPKSTCYVLVQGIHLLCVSAGSPLAMC